MTKYRLTGMNGDVEEENGAPAPFSSPVNSLIFFDDA